MTFVSNSVEVLDTVEMLRLALKLRTGCRLASFLIALGGEHRHCRSDVMGSDKTTHGRPVVWILLQPPGGQEIGPLMPSGMPSGRVNQPLGNHGRCSGFNGVSFTSALGSILLPLAIQGASHARRVMLLNQIVRQCVLC